MTSARWRLAVSSAIVVALAGCTTSGPGAGNTSSSRSTSAPCAGEAISTVSDERLTVATYDPVFAPWFVSNDPGNGQGFESALAFQVAKEMGYEPHVVRWVRVPFEQILKPRRQAFDLAFAEVSITPERRRSVDFSTPYAATRQAVITHAGSSIEKTSSVDDLRDVKLGASVQTTSLNAIEKIVAPTTEPVEFPTIAAGATALDEQQVDGVVVDEPTAEYLAGSRLKDGRLLGVLPQSREEIGAVLPKGSDLRPCVNRALRAVAGDNRLADLRREWLPDGGAVTELTRATPTPTDRTVPRSSSRSGEPAGTPTATTGRTSPSPAK